MYRISVSLLLASAGLGVFAQSSTQDPKPNLPKIFDTAQYVCVEAESGELTSRDLTTEDRQAIYNVEKQLKAWGRYNLTLSCEHADLVVRVHKSRVGSNNIPVVVSGGPRQPGSRSPFPSDPSNPSSPAQNGPGLGAEAGSPDDELSVYISSGSSSSGVPVWHDSSKNGLNTPRLPLFQELKQDVKTLIQGKEIDKQIEGELCTFGELVCSHRVATILPGV